MQRRDRAEEDEDIVRHGVTFDKMHVPREAIAKHGQTEGFPACDAIGRRGHLPGQLGYKHSATCRRRVIEEMMDDPEYRTLMQKHAKFEGASEFEVFSEETKQKQANELRTAIMKIEQKQKNENLGKQMNVVMMQMFVKQMEVAETYSPPRVAAMAREMGFRAGWSLDLTTCDDDGREWDFNSLVMRSRAIRKLLQDKPLVLVGSPMCGPFSCMNHINYSKMCQEEVEQRIVYGRRHSAFCAKFYKIQVEQGRYFSMKTHDRPHQGKRSASNKYWKWKAYFM